MRHKSGSGPWPTAASEANGMPITWGGIDQILRRRRSSLSLAVRYLAGRNEQRFESFHKARKFVHSLHLKNRTEWNKHSASDARPWNIPSNPWLVYSEWNSINDWLGTKGIVRNGKWMPFNQARAFVHSLGLRSERDGWRQYCKSGKKPINIPVNPARAYSEWINWGDWLGTGSVSPEFKAKSFMSFIQARECVHKLGLCNEREWRIYSKSHKLSGVPSTPARHYDEWINWGDWLGTGSVSPKVRHLQMRNFNEARKYVHTLGIKSQTEWNKFRKSNQRPRDIPGNPYRTYAGQWRSWPDWLGTA